MKRVYYVAASLDGFIADVDHQVEWLDQLNIDHQSTGYEEFFEKVDGLLMGRRTYDFVYDYGQWHYEDRPTWVCSHRPIPKMDGCNLQSERMPDAAVRQAEQRGIETLWVVGGGQLVSTLIEQQLLTHISVSVMPVLLGAGIPLVHSLSETLHLRQEASASRSGFTQIEYRIDR